MPLAAPTKAKKYYEQTKARYPEKGKSYAARVGWSIY